MGDRLGASAKRGAIEAERPAPTIYTYCMILQLGPDCFTIKMVFCAGQYRPPSRRENPDGTGVDIRERGGIRKTAITARTLVPAPVI